MDEIILNLECNIKRFSVLTIPRWMSNSLWWKMKWDNRMSSVISHKSWISYLCGLVYNIDWGYTYIIELILNLIIRPFCKGIKKCVCREST